QKCKVVRAASAAHHWQKLRFCADTAAKAAATGFTQHYICRTTYYFKNKVTQTKIINQLQIC
ncbi:MAG: hypothetical protein ACKVTZ_23655, partial [Bacteroidia bacterium]